VTETKYPVGTEPSIGDIAKNDASGGLRAFSYGAQHPAVALWVHPQTGLFARLAAEMDRRAAHPARTVVLLPYAQLLPLANRLWLQHGSDGFAPRFETSMNWCTALGGYARQATDITFDMGLDHLTAQAMLAAAGLGAQQDALAGLLVQAAWQLAPLAAAAGPDQRALWADGARQAVLTGVAGNAALQWEVAVAKVAVEWVAISGYPGDVLFAPQVRAGVDCLVVVEGLAPDPMTEGLRRVWGEKLVALPLAQGTPVLLGGGDAGHTFLHACLDAEDEAQRSAACALAHIAQGRFPVALVSSDRALTRRVRAMLEDAGVAMRDENGWKLSTSRVAASVMTLLRAAQWNASSDAVLEWAKVVPAFSGTVDALEAAVRDAAIRDWSAVAMAPAMSQRAELLATCTVIDTVRDRFKGRRTLAAWLQALASALQECALWDAMAGDDVGAKVLACLQLEPANPQEWSRLKEGALWAGARMDLGAFTRWVNQALEGASFQPAYPAEEQVVILPMSQMLGRPFAACVLAGCDEVRLNPGVEPPGGWTAAQRAALGLPSRDALEALMHATWTQALQTPVCDVLWRTSDDAGETLLPSSLVQLLQAAAGDAAQGGIDPRLERTVPIVPVLPPQPVGAALPVKHLSASAYEDMRQCPYRFFALRQLGLKTVDELDGEVDKRDFGLWLHAVLAQFHAALQSAPTEDATVRSRMLDQTAEEITRSMALPEGEFLPFMAAWPQVRDGYLKWLTVHEAQGARFASGETSHRQQVGEVQLVGRIDRTDTFADGTVMVLDYKTEPVAKSRSRVKEPLEDTQIAFYAALLDADTLRGAYVNVGERDGTAMSEQEHLVEARDALLEGIQVDMQRIRDGAPLPALGDAGACDFCQARGMCRKDFWSVP